MKTKLMSLSAGLAFVVLLAGCGEEPKYQGPALPYTPQPPKPKQPDLKGQPEPVVELETSEGRITLQLFEDAAPNTVANFISLAEQGFYNGLTFHRIIKDFMLQGGDPKGDGSGGPGYKFPDEFAGNPNKVVQYALCMANSGPATNGSQFFIVTAKNGCPWLDGKHTVFGKVTDGTDVVDKLNLTPTGQNDKPVTPVKIVTVRVVKKRDHVYEVKNKVPEPGAPLTIPVGKKDEETKAEDKK
jgi:cyclophilin family peptidyl-prolyl cis-trans isomerase